MEELKQFGIQRLVEIALKKGIQNLYDSKTNWWSYKKELPRYVYFRLKQEGIDDKDLNN